MTTYFQDPTPEYIEFIKEYNCFLKFYIETKSFCMKEYIPNSDNTEYFSQYKHAIKAHIEAKNAYIRLVTRYGELVLKHSGMF